MENEIKCPNCGGNKYTMVDETTAKCRYCDTIFKVKENKPTPPPQATQAATAGTQQAGAAQAQPQERIIIVQQPAQQAAPQYMRRHDRSKITAGILALLLGGLGIHKFYLGKGGQGILYLIFCWTWIPSIIAFIEGIIYLTMDEDKFDQKYNY